MKKLLFVLSLFSSAHCYSQHSTASQTTSIAINSIDSDDFSDLKAFDSIFASKRILFLGESQHGINDFNLLKYRLIRYLHQQHQFEVVAFESSIGECGLTNLAKNQLGGMEMLIHALKGIWRVKGNCEMMDYIRDQQMELAGFDPNSGALGLNATQYNYLLKDEILSTRFIKADSLFLFNYKMTKQNWKQQNIAFDKVMLENTIQYLNTEYSQLLKEIKKKSDLSDKEKIIFSKSIIAQLQELNMGLDKKKKDYYIDGQQRDRLMASYITALADSLYKDKKIIIWAHNAHVAKTGTPMINEGVSIGDYLPSHIKDQSFIIGLYATSGQYAWGANTPETIKLRQGSLEKEYSTFPSKALYLSTNKMIDHKYYHGIPDFSRADISKLYDGVIFIKDVKASRLIAFNKEMRCE